MSAFLWLLSRLPLRVSHGVCGLLAWVWWLVLPIRRSTARENLRQAFPGMNAGPTLRESVRSMLLGYVEFSAESRRSVLELNFQGFESLVDRAERGQGSLVLTGHGGAWELLGLASARELRLPISLIARVPTDASTRATIRSLREAYGLEILPPEGSFFQAAQAYERGRVVVFLLDQRHNRGIPVEFFGRPAWTSRALALLAKRKEAPVFGAWAFREGIGRHMFRLEGPLPLGSEIEDNTQRFSEFMASRIRERPAHWLWLHDRWRVPKEAK